MIDTVFLHVTRACNLRCRYCYFSAASADPDEMSRPEYAALWPDVVRLAPRKIVFTGGEPFVRGDLLDIIGDLAEADAAHAVLRCVNSNGIGMTRERAGFMIGLVDEVRVSLDGFRDIHDRHRGSGSFDAAVAALDVLQEEGFEPKVLITVTAEAIGGLGAFLQWLAGRKLTRIRLNPVRPIGRASDMPELAVDIEELARVVGSARRAMGAAAPLAQGTLPRSCGAGHFLNVMPNGDVFPCHVLTDRALRAGNVRTDRLASIAGPGSMLERLRNVDLRDAAGASPEAARALGRLACLGVVREQLVEIMR